MNSILANIFLAVQERIAAEVSQVKWIDQELGQLEFEVRPSVIFPAVLLDIVNINYSEEGENSQLAEATLEVRLAVTAYNPSAQVHPKERKQKALEYYDIEHNLNKALHGWSDTEFFSPLNRVSSQTERRQDNVRVRPLRYQFAFRDNTAMVLPASTVPRPDLDLDNGYQEN